MHALFLAAALTLTPPCEIHLANVSPDAGMGAPTSSAPTDRAARRKRILFVSRWLQAAMIASSSGRTLGTKELGEWVDEALGEDARLETFDEQRSADTIEFLRANAVAAAPPFGKFFLRYHRR